MKRYTNLWRYSCKFNPLTLRKTPKKEHLRLEITRCTFGTIGHLALVVSLSLAVHNVQGWIGITTYRGTGVQSLGIFLDCLMTHAFEHSGCHEVASVAASFDCQKKRCFAFSAQPPFCRNTCRRIKHHRYKSSYATDRLPRSLMTFRSLRSIYCALRQVTSIM